MRNQAAIRPHDASRAGARRLPQPSELPPAFLGRDPGVHRMLDAARRLARTDQPVLLFGETGTGKELVARTVHHASPRAAGPFRAVNCASLPVGLHEAELFGAARGAFTGAVEGRGGLLEAAHGGTLFLDEIGDMPPALQAVLLRVLEDGETRRIGETEERRVDIRIVAATHRDLPAMAREGTFRQDLLFRLGRVLRLPPLRERPGDVLLLGRAFLREAGGGSGPGPTLDPAAEAWLTGQSFPGNVRQLKCLLLGAAALSEDGVIGLDLLREGIGEEVGRPAPAPLASPPPFPSSRSAVEESVLDALRAAGPSATSFLVRETGLPRRTVQRALAELVRSGGARRGGRGPATRYLASRES